MNKFYIFIKNFKAVRLILVLIWPTIWLVAGCSKLNKITKHVCPKSWSYDCGSLNGPVEIVDSYGCISDKQDNEIVYWRPSANKAGYYRVGDIKEDWKNNGFIIQRVSACYVEDFISDEDIAKFVRVPGLCNNTQSFRIENEEVCSQATSDDTYAVINSCSETSFFDTQVTDGRYFGYRKLNVSFRIENYDPTASYSLFIYDNYNLNNSIPMPVDINTDSDKLRGVVNNLNKDHSSVVLWHEEGNDVVGITEITSFLGKNNYSPYQGSENKSYLYTTMIGINRSAQSSKFFPTGTYCRFTATNVDQSNPEIQTRQAIMNLYVLHNAGSTFNSHASGYTYLNKSFNDYMVNLWERENVCRVNIVHIVLPGNILDNNGNIVFYAEDIPGGRTLQLGGVGSLPEVNEKEFRNYMTTQWKNRLKNYIIYALDHPKEAALGPIQLPLKYLNDNIKQSQYHNSLSILITNSYTAKLFTDPFIDIDDYAMREELNAFTTTYTDNQRGVLNSEGKVRSRSDLAPDGVTMGFLENQFYNPISLVFGFQADDFFDSSDPEYSGRIIKTALHEIGHGWFFKGSTCEEGEENDYVSYYKAHTCYNYSPDDITKPEHYYCIMKPKGKPNDDLITTINFYTEQDKRMRYSPGVYERLRKVLKPTYSIAE